MASSSVHVPRMLVSKVDTRVAVGHADLASGRPGGTRSDVVLAEHPLDQGLVLDGTAHRYRRRPAPAYLSPTDDCGTPSWTSTTTRAPWSVSMDVRLPPRKPVAPVTATARPREKAPSGW